MTGREIEKGLFGLVGDAREIVGEIWKTISHPLDDSVAETGLGDIKTFSVPIDEGGKSRFLPALAIAVAAVSQDRGIEPEDVFEDFKGLLDKRGRPMHRSDKPTSTKRTIEALYTEEDEVSDFLEGVEIASADYEDSEDRVQELAVPANNQRSVLLMPFNRKLFNKTVELPKDISTIPLWGVAFGTYHPSDGHHKVRGADLSPVSVLYRVAFPVPPGLVGHEHEGTTDEVSALDMMRTLSRGEIMAGHKNMSYVVSQRN